jgi:hypothetical protein
MVGPDLASKDVVSGVGFAGKTIRLKGGRCSEISSIKQLYPSDFEMEGSDLSLTDEPLNIDLSILTSVTQGRSRVIFKGKEYQSAIPTIYLWAFRYT